jgi:hypothetical protein
LNTYFYPTVTGELMSAFLFLLWFLLVMCMLMSVCPSLVGGHSSNEQVTLARISLLEVIVAMSSFYPSLLRYYCSDIVAAMSRMYVAIVAYDMLLQWCVIVVVSNA